MGKLSLRVGDLVLVVGVDIVLCLVLRVCFCPQLPQLLDDCPRVPAVRVMRCVCVRVVKRRVSEGGG